MEHVGSSDQEPRGLPDGLLLMVKGGAVVAANGDRLDARTEVEVEHRSARPRVVLDPESHEGVELIIGQGTQGIHEDRGGTRGARQRIEDRDGQA